MLGGRGWQWQWERVQGHLKEVRAVYSGRDGGTYEALDATLSFFEVIHHLKDWLGNDPSSGLTKADGDALIGNSLILKLCADLANGSKHLSLTSTRTGDRSTSITRNDVIVSMDSGVSHVFYVGSNGTEYDVLQIAEAAVVEWAQYLTGKGLL